MQVHFGTIVPVIIVPVNGRIIECATETWQMHLLPF